LFKKIILWSWGGILAFCAIYAPALQAEPFSSNWVKTDQSSVRLIAGQTHLGPDGKAALGLQFRMLPGWKVYWRSPGDAGVPPRIMGIGPAPATEKLLARTGLGIKDIDIIELNEAFASQGLAVMRQLGLADDAEHVNPNGGAIALGHPLGMSGARIALTATQELHERGVNRAICTMCIGVGQGIALLLERV